MSPFEGVMTAVLALNSLGIFGLLFKSGMLVGQNDQRWQDLYKRISTMEEIVRDGNDSKVEIARLQEAVRSLQQKDENPRHQIHASHTPHT